jgi:hypothetical protein
MIELTVTNTIEKLKKVFSGNSSDLLKKKQNVYKNLLIIKKSNQRKILRICLKFCRKGSA